MSTAFTKPAFQAPKELKALDQWVLWRQETRRGKSTKVPYQRNGSLAKTDDSGTWISYTEVCAAFRSDRFSGIGFVFSECDPYAGIDLDDRLDNSGLPKPWASPILEQFAPNYCGISPVEPGVKSLAQRNELRQRRATTSAGRADFWETPCRELLRLNDGHFGSDGSAD